MELPIKDLITDKISGEWGDEAAFEEGVKVIRTANFTNQGAIDFSNLVYRSIDPRKVKSKKIRKGDIIIEKSGGSPSQPVGRVVFFELNTNEDYLCNNFTSILRPDQNKVFPKYLFYQMLTAHKNGRTQRYQNKTTGIINLKLDNYLNEKVLIPSLPDQIKIASILTKAEELIEQRKNSIKLLDEFLKSTFYKMFGDPTSNSFGWYIDTLSKFGSFKNGLNYSNNESGVTISCLGVGDFKDHSRLSDFKSLRTVNLTEEPHQDFFLQDRDLVFVRSNGNKELVGRCLVVFPKQERVTFSGFCIRYRIKSGALNSVFLSHLFRIPRFRKLMLQNGRGANIQNISQEILTNLKIPIPPIELQNQFVEIVEKTESLKTNLSDSLIELDKLFGSLSKKVFKGELDLSGVNVEQEAKLMEEIKKDENVDIQNMSLDDYYGIPDDLREQYGSIENHIFDWEFFFKKHFSGTPAKPITVETVERLHRAYNYERGVDFDYDEFCKVVFKELGKENSILKQEFNIETKQLQLIINEIKTA